MSWILNFDSVITDPAEILKRQYQTIIVLDCGDLKYAGLSTILSQLAPEVVLINIDHHLSNENFGHINLVDTTLASTTEIVYSLFKAWEIPIPTSVANGLLAGLLYDTYNFTNSNTSEDTLKVASELLLAGAWLPQVSESILKNKTIGAVQLWGQALSRLQYNKRYGIATTVITEKDLAELPDALMAIEGVANLLNNLGNVKAALILQQIGPNVIKGSFRTNDDLIDVSKLAKILGGGGHKKASGFKINGRLVETETGWQVV